MVPNSAEVDDPVAFTVLIPSAHVSEVSLMEEGTKDSEPFVCADSAARVGVKQIQDPQCTERPAVKTGFEPRSVAEKRCN
jgi:hypothetical protein